MHRTVIWYFLQCIASERLSHALVVSDPTLQSVAALAAPRAIELGYASSNMTDGHFEQKRLEMKRSSFESAVLEYFHRLTNRSGLKKWVPQEDEKIHVMNSKVFSVLS